MQTDIHLPEDFIKLMEYFPDKQNNTIYESLYGDIKDNFTTIKVMERALKEIRDLTYLKLNRMAILIAESHGVSKGQLRNTPRGKLRITDISFDNDRMHDGIRIVFNDDSVGGISLTTVLQDTTLVRN